MAVHMIRRFIFGLPVDQLFVTRNVLHCGRRGAVDKALSRLVLDEVIVRVARGVFARVGSRAFSTAEVAFAKAQAFAKTIARHPQTIGSELGFLEDSSSNTLFAVSGASSRFRCGDATIELHHNSPRKLMLGQSKAGEAVKALWQVGRLDITSDHISRATENFCSRDRREFTALRRWMPSWLSNLVFLAHRELLPN